MLADAEADRLVQAVYLHVLSTNEPALALYVAHGFTVAPPGLLVGFYCIPAPRQPVPGQARYDALCLVRYLHGLKSAESDLGEDAAELMEIEPLPKQNWWLEDLLTATAAWIRAALGGCVAPRRGEERVE